VVLPVSIAAHVLLFLVFRRFAPLRDSLLWFAAAEAASILTSTLLGITPVRLLLAPYPFEREAALTAAAPKIVASSITLPLSIPLPLSKLIHKEDHRPQKQRRDDPGAYIYNGIRREDVLRDMRGGRADGTRRRPSVPSPHPHEEHHTYN
jgi:hypothetical protein